MKSYVFILALCTLGTVFSGCNTMEGFGQDVQKAGHSIEKSAK